MDNLDPYLKGLLQTQALLLNDHFDLYELPTCESISANISPNQRLGHFAEKLFFYLLSKNHASDEILTNIQIIDQNSTLGELDALILSNNELKHVEFCYKIYLLDPTLSDKEFECWIGPNRRDSLKQKVDKLLTKQLPLLENKHTVEILKAKSLLFSELSKSQSVCFLGQLYVPYKDYAPNQKFEYGHANGFYIYFEDLSNFSESEWFIPHHKVDWLLSPTLSVSWFSTDQLITKLNEHYTRGSNPLCWMKDQGGNLFKCFVVNWNI